MARYSYACTCGHRGEFQFGMGTAPAAIGCGGCGALMNRDLATDLETIVQRKDDKIRDAWLSSKIEHNLADQQRPLDPLAPKDKFEAKRVHERTGRVYFGDDDSQLSPAARKAIDKGRRGEFEYQGGKKSLA